jgi:hypothetical protein
VPSVIPAYSQTDPIEVRIVIDEPTHDGLYLQNDRIGFTIYFINHGDQPVDLSYGFDHTQIETESSLAKLESGFNTLQPNSNFSYPHNRGYSAGNYRIYATAFANNTAFGDSKEFFFTVSTPLELYNKQALNYTLYGLGISAVIAATAILTAIWTRRQNQRQREDNNKNNEEQRRDFREYVDRQLSLQKESNDELKESNRLTIESLKLKQKEIDISIGEPDLELVNPKIEPGTGSTITLVPNYRNDGKVPASNVRVNYKIFDLVVTEEDIVRVESEIKSSFIEVPGSVYPTKSINIRALKLDKTAIEWSKKDPPKPQSVALWYTYVYGESETPGETLFHVQYQDRSLISRPVKYSSSQIDAIRKRIK